MCVERDGEYEIEEVEDTSDIAARVNWFDVLSILFTYIRGLFGVTADLFHHLAGLSGTHSLYRDAQHSFRMAVAQDIESLDGE